jgi:hypothetical protein
MMAGGDEMKEDQEFCFLFSDGTPFLVKRQIHVRKNGSASPVSSHADVAYFQSLLGLRKVSCRPRLPVALSWARVDARRRALKTRLV